MNQVQLIITHRSLRYPYVNSSITANAFSWNTMIQRNGYGAASAKEKVPVGENPKLNSIRNSAAPIKKTEENILAASYVGCFTWPPKRYWAPKPPCIKQISYSKFIQPSTSSQSRDDRTRCRGSTEHHPDFWKNLIATLLCIFAELGLTPRQEFMHALSEAAKMPTENMNPSSKYHSLNQTLKTWMSSVCLRLSMKKCGISPPPPLKHLQLAEEIPLSEAHALMEEQTDTKLPVQKYDIRCPLQRKPMPFVESPTPLIISPSTTDPSILPFFT